MVFMYAFRFVLPQLILCDLKNRVSSSYEWQFFLMFIFIFERGREREREREREYKRGKGREQGRHII